MGVLVDIWKHFISPLEGCDRVVDGLGYTWEKFKVLYPFKIWLCKGQDFFMCDECVVGVITTHIAS